MMHMADRGTCSACYRKDDGTISCNGEIKIDFCKHGGDICETCSENPGVEFTAHVEIHEPNMANGVLIAVSLL